MELGKAATEKELTHLLHHIFQLPEVDKVQIRSVELSSSKEKDLIKRSVEECYHDILSDIDLKVHATLHPEDVKGLSWYHSIPERLGFTQDRCLGLAMTDGGGSIPMFRIILKSGVRFDLGFTVIENPMIPRCSIPVQAKEALLDTDNCQPRWEMQKALTFWFNQVLALSKLMRNDYLIADHLANLQINETLVAQMIDRDDRCGTNFHRYGYREMLDYRTVAIPDFPFAVKDETYGHITRKLYSAAISYDRQVSLLNPAYEERSSIFFELWKQYDSGL
jgi:hypothetical protein